MTQSTNTVMSSRGKGTASSQSPNRNRFGFQSSPRKFSAAASKPPQYNPCLSDERKNLKTPAAKTTVERSSGQRKDNLPSASQAANDRYPDVVSTAKAAYLCVKPSLSEEIESVEELELALQFSGLNPTPKSIKKCWKERPISFKDFEGILELENVSTKDELAVAFAKLDPTGSGKIPRQTLKSVLVNRGEKLPTGVVNKHVDNPEFCDPESGNFNYIVFLNETLKTSAHLLRQLKNITAESEKNLAINSNTYKVRRKASSPQKQVNGAKSRRENWTTSLESKGAFYFEGESLISHQYNLETRAPQEVEISIESLDSTADCQLFIFKVNEVAVNRNSDTRYLLVERTPMTTPKQHPGNGKNSVSWTGRLEPGTYLLVPSTTGCKLRKRKLQPASDVSLVDVEVGTGGKRSVTLSDAFRRVLTDIFDQVDLDKSGGLSREEFNLFNWRTSGEEVRDEEWKVVRENFEVSNGELTLGGFMRLHQMEAEDNGGDSAELWVTLNAMGYNYNLVQDEAALFKLMVRGEDAENVPDFYVSGLRSGGPILDKTMIKCVMDSCVEPQSIDGNPDFLLYREDSSNSSSVVVQNKSASTVALNMDFGRSKNVLINHPHTSFSTTLSARSTLLVAHLIPDDANLDHSVTESVTLARG